MHGKMTTDELNSNIKRFGYDSLHDLCIDAGNHARIPIPTNQVRTQIARSDRLTRWQTIAFRAFFAMKEGKA